MLCEEVMTKDPKCCIPTDSAVRAAKLMKTEDVGSIPVCGSRESRRLVGIVTDRDLAIQIVAEARDPNSTRVEAVMSRDPITCRPDEDLQTALQRMESNQVRRIPVVDGNGVVVGIISQADIATRSRNPEKTAEVVEEISRSSGMHG
jgi:CBS domain-containing protein